MDMRVMERTNVTEQSINKPIKLFSLEGLKGLHTNTINFISAVSMIAQNRKHKHLLRF